MRKLILPALLLTAAVPAARAQSVGPSTLNAAGGSAIIAGNTYEYAVATEITGPTAMLLVTPGPLQPAEGTSCIADAPGFAAQLALFPNPAQTLLHLQPSLAAGTEIFCTLADAAGKVVLRHSARLATGSEKQTLNLAPLAAGTYLLTVREGETKTATFKVQKIQ